MLNKIAVGCALAVLTCHLAVAQTTTRCSNSSNLGCLIPNVYGPNGLTLPNPFHEAHFESTFQANFSPLNAAIATELTLLPLASPASGFTYTFDRASGVYTRSAQSFGPILAERAETIGKGKFFVGFTYQYFNFDSLDGIDLNRIPAVFRHSLHSGPGGTDPPYENDFITTNNNITLFVNQMTAFATVGLTNRFDVSLAVPILNVNLGIRSAATIHRTAPPDPVFGQSHFFDANDPNGSVNKTFTDSGHSTGIGDVTLRLKGTLLRGEHASLALATDVRFPTGDERDFLGSGTYGVRPFLIGSFPHGKVSPHFNIGYQINGNSILAGDVLTGTKGHLANNLFYTVGADVGVNKRLTLAFDLLGQRVFGATRVAMDTPFTSPVAEIPAPGVTIQQNYQQIVIRTGSFNMISGSAGFKVQVAGNLLLTANALFQLNNDGLKAKVVPLVGLSYTF
jgi:hypothetical protein